MKRTYKYALSAVLSAAIVVPAIAQDNFPDVAANHWAYEAVARLKKDGILVGYPDGQYKGARPATRYELAAAVHAAYVNLKNQSDGVASQITALTEKVSSNQVTKADLDNLKAALATAQNDINAMKGWGDDIAALKKLTAEFQKELQSMGVDVETIKKNLGDLGDRVTALEKRKLPVDISGDVNLLMLGGYSASDTYGITVDGRPTGVGRGDYGGEGPAHVGATKDLSMFHEVGLKLTSTNDSGPKWFGTVVIGNMLADYAQGWDNNGGQAFPSQSQVAPGHPFMEGNEDIYVQDLGVHWDTSVMSWGFGVDAGRLGVKVSPLILQRPDVTPYFANGRWDNGEYALDGINMAFNVSKAKVRIFGGRNNASEGGTVGNFDEIQSLSAGQNNIPFFVGDNRPVGFDRRNQDGYTGLFDINQTLGVTLGLPLGANGNLNLAYLWLDSNWNLSGIGPNYENANGVHVYGGDLSFNAAGFALTGAYSKSDVVYNNHSVITKQNDAYIVSAAKDFGKWGAKVGYRQMNPQFGAPGDWGRIGIWWNPTDIKGFTADAHLNLSDSTKLTFAGQFYSGTGNTVVWDGSDYTGLGTNDKITSLVIGLHHKLGASNSIDLGYENVTWDLKDRAAISFTGGKPVERWYNIGFNHQINANSAFKFLWQISDYDSKGVAGFNPFNSNSNLGRPGTAKGGLITTQLSIKFG